MKILWVNLNFLHPTTKGGQIRTLAILKHLHQKHEIHYATLEDPVQTEGPRRASEYCTTFASFRHKAPGRTSPRFVLQAAFGMFSSMPLAVSRWISPELGRHVRQQVRSGQFDRAVCDFLAPAPHFDDLSRTVLFQHNVETMIWRRHADAATGLARKAYFQLQAQRMFEYERRVCRDAGAIIAVSAHDADSMRKMFGVSEVHHTATGVDIAYFSARPAEPAADLVFSGSMDWMPNIDGINWFAAEILPLIRKGRPECSLAVAGRTPAASVRALGETDPRVRITGTVPDIRPWLWGSKVSIVPLRVGGGTRLKIYEAMAAGIPVVSTTVGAEGLEYTDGENILIADSPEQFADGCVRLLSDPDLARRISGNARDLVASRFSWDRVASDFATILAAAPACR